jgi:hypothetical protein
MSTPFIEFFYDAYDTLLGLAVSPFSDIESLCDAEAWIGSHVFSLLPIPLANTG